VKIDLVKPRQDSWTV